MTKTARNLPRSPLTSAQRTAALLRNNTGNRFCPPLNLGPLNVKRATGANASI